MNLLGVDKKKMMKMKMKMNECSLLYSRSGARERKELSILSNDVMTEKEESQTEEERASVEERMSVMNRKAGTLSAYGLLCLIVLNA